MHHMWSPGDLAQYDQFLAQADETLDTLTSGLQKMIAESGEPTAMAQLTASLIQNNDPVAVLGLLTVALRRLVIRTSQPLS